MAFIQRTVCSCDVCGHEWIPAFPGKEPARCPSRKCRSAVWNRNQDGVEHQAVVPSTTGIRREVEQPEPELMEEQIWGS